jgi:hypothetical protein
MPGSDYRGWNSRDFFLNGKPLLTFDENFPRDQITTDLVASIVTAVMTSVAFPMVQGNIVTSLTFLSGATALGTPTHAWAALYDVNGNLLAQSADQPALAWAADTAVTFTLATPQTVPVTGVYYAALMVAATVVPTLMGKSVGRAKAAGAIITGQAILAQNSGAALTTTAPATIASPTTQPVIPYCLAQ